MSNNERKWIYFVNFTKIEEDLFRLYFQLSNKEISTLDSFVEDRQNYDWKDYNSFYIDVSCPYNKELIENADYLEIIRLQAFYKIKEMLKNKVIFYSSTVSYSNKSINTKKASDLIEEIIIPNDVYVLHRYWHMQIHTNNSSWGKEKELLEKKQLIGISKEKNSEYSLSLFREEMQIGDVVLIRRGSLPIALVLVTGDLEYENINDKERLDWFEWRRKVRILSYYNDNEYDFLNQIGTLKRSVDKTSFTYRYIDNKYRKFIKLTDNNNKLFISNLKIKSYKKFDNFEINFKDKNGNALPLVVLAGINGSGKTSIMDLIDKSFTDYKSLKDCELEFEFEDEHEKFFKASYIEDWQYFSLNYTNHIIYIKAGIDSSNDIIFASNKYIQDKIDNEDYRLSEANESLKKIIDEALNALDVSFYFNSIKNGKLYFENNESTLFEFDDLSTGERTLITKLVMLHLQSNNLDGKIVMIDEPETSLHPSWQTRILKLYKNVAETCNCQIIIATHSPHIISSTPSECLRLLKDEDGKIFCYTADYSYGQDFSNILLGVMGVESIRDPYMQSKIQDLAYLLHEYGPKDSRFIELNKDLTSKLGEFDSELNLIKLQASIR